MWQNVHRKHTAHQNVKYDNEEDTNKFQGEKKLRESLQGQIEDASRQQRKEEISTPNDSTQRKWKDQCST